jgi:hypothetical protein
MLMRALQASRSYKQQLENLQQSQFEPVLIRRDEASGRGKGDPSPSSVPVRESDVGELFCLSGLFC